MGLVRGFNATCKASYSGLLFSGLYIIVSNISSFGFQFVAVHYSTSIFATKPRRHDDSKKHNINMGSLVLYGKRSRYERTL